MSPVDVVIVVDGPRSGAVEQLRCVPMPKKSLALSLSMDQRPSGRNGTSCASLEISTNGDRFELLLLVT
jgi:hypothetical protein